MKLLFKLTFLLLLISPLACGDINEDDSDGGDGEKIIKEESDKNPDEIKFQLEECRTSLKTSINNYEYITIRCLQCCPEEDEECRSLFPDFEYCEENICDFPSADDCSEENDSEEIEKIKLSDVNDLQLLQGLLDECKISLLLECSKNNKLRNECLECCPPENEDCIRMFDWKSICKYYSCD